MTRQINMDKEDYTSVFKCIRCGQCTYGKEAAGFTVLCPVNKKGHFFSYSAGGMMQIARSLYEGKIDDINSLQNITTLCTTCGICDVNCGVIDNPLNIIIKIRKLLMDQDLPGSKKVSKVTDRIVEHKNRYGISHEKRTAWLENRSKKIDNPLADILYFTGCVSAYDQKEIPKALDGILSRLDIAYTVASDEQCCGGPLYFSGLQDQARKQAEHNIKMVEDTGIKTVVASCPTCALMLKKYYPQWTGKKLPFKILHTMEYLENLMEQGKLGHLSLEENTNVIYHDPCHLGRGLGIYEAPRRLLKAIDNLKLAEFDLCDENSMCCGGGGLLPVTNASFSREIAKSRLDAIPENQGKNRIERFVSACPTCRKTVGLAAERDGKGIMVNDICELVLESLRAE